MRKGLKKRTAGRDDRCDHCGYPFDQGDHCYGFTLEDGDFDWEVFCSKHCASEWDRIQAQRERRAS